MSIRLTKFYSIRKMNSTLPQFSLVHGINFYQDKYVTFRTLLDHRHFLILDHLGARQLLN